MAAWKVPWQHSRVLRLVTIAFVLLAPLAASAQAGDGSEDALSRARAAIRDGEPEHALAILEAARETSTDPEIERELYLAHEQLGHPVEAARHLAVFLDADVALDPDERRELEEHLALMRGGPPSRPARGDPALVIAGWGQLIAGIAGMVVFLGGAGIAFALENSLDDDCMTSPRFCEPGARDPIHGAWTVSMIGLGAGLVLTTLGAIDLVLAEVAQSGASHSLPPDLDPTVQRTFTLAPWASDEGAGVAARLVF